MTDRELMQQALDAMLNFPDDISDDMFESIKALRARLAQPEFTDEKGRPVTYWGGLAQPEPEPVAWITTWNEPNDAGVELHWEKKDKGASSKHTPLYYNNEGRSKK